MPDALTEKRTRLRDSIDARLDELPVLPEVVRRIAAMAPSSAHFNEQVEELASVDPPLTARLLRLAPAGPGGRVVSSVAQGIATIGARHLAETITSLTVMRVFVPATTGQRNLWIHAIGTALIARRLAELAPTHSIAPEHAYLIGLMHDLGRFVMYDRSPAELGAVDETHWSSPQELIAAELEICGYDHAFLGALVAERWSFPDLVTVTIRDHHVCGIEQTATWAQDAAREVHLLQAADRISLLILNQPQIVNRPEAEQAALLQKHCAHPSWIHAPFNPRQLAPELAALERLTRQRATHLGVTLSAK